MAYFSNGTEGEILDAQCADCPVGSDFEAPCPVLFAQSNWNYKQIDKKGSRKTMAADILNVLVNEKGQCQMRKVMLESDSMKFIIGTDVQCPMCGSRDFNCEHRDSSGAAGEHWIKSCAACGHEYPN